MMTNFRCALGGCGPLKASPYEEKKNGPHAGDRTVERGTRPPRGGACMPYDHQVSRTHDVGSIGARSACPTTPRGPRLTGDRRVHTGLVLARAHNVAAPSDSGSTTSDFRPSLGFAARATVYMRRAGVDPRTSRWLISSHMGNQPRARSLPFGVGGGLSSFGAPATVATGNATPPVHAIATISAEV